MALIPGTRLGPYEILAPLGAGGMGEVYKARDTRLDRTVAIKVLPTEVAADPLIRARFEREARAIAALSHPHICTVHDVGRHDDTDYLVMELLDGETLGERLAKTKGPLPLEQVLSIGVAIADALDKAHRAGFVHRDLKPANVMLTKAGPKLLDFGLAKLHSPAASVALDVETCSTLAGPATATGTILGTLDYMAPEQVEGREADTRSDIWALGAVLYEMATGERPFEGASPASIIGAILKDTSPALSARQPLTPQALEHLVERCLEKDPDERWQDVRDVKRELAWIAAGRARSGKGEAAAPIPPSSPRSSRVLTLLPWLLVVLVAGGAALWPSSKSAQSVPVTRSLLEFPQFALSGARIGNLFVLSPDGTRLVYVGNPDGKNQLYVRRLDQFDATAIGGTEDAIQPFFSPDGTSVGFFARGKLKKVALAGGAPITLADAPIPFGGAWGQDDTIVFAPGPAGLMRIPAGGGVPERVTKVPETGVQRHSWPTTLPGGKAVLYTVVVNTLQAHIDAVSLATGEVKTVVPSGACPQLVGGLLVYTDTLSGALTAVSFDEARLEISGTPAAVLEGVMASSASSQFSVSKTGSLVYLPNTSVSLRKLVWVDRLGRTSPAMSQTMAFGTPRLAPDGQRIAFLTYEGMNPRDIWVYDLAREAMTRLTTEGRLNTVPQWSPDGRHIVFSSIRDGSHGQQSLFVTPLDGSGSAELVVKSDFVQSPAAWSPTENTLVYTEVHPESQYDLWMVNLDGDRKARPFFGTPGNERAAAFSPDGRYLAYSSDNSGRSEIYVREFPGPGQTRLISTEGGSEPTWSRRGELFYRQGDKMMVVRVQTTPMFSASKPDTLFEGRYEVALLTPGIQMYDIQQDGQRFLMVKSDSPSVPRQLRLVTNWVEDIRRAAGK